MGAELVAKAADRVVAACSAFGQTLKNGGIAHINISTIRADSLLSDRRIVVTGGGSGIGLAIAKKCVDSGASVVITGRNEDKLAAAVKSLGTKCASYLVWDITDSSIVDDKIKYCDHLLNGIDVVVNNAGVEPREFFPDVTAEEWDRVYETNSRGTFLVSEGFCRYWMEHSSGSYRYLINISSQGGFVGATYPYRMSKWDIRGLTEGLGLAMAPYGVLVNGVAPGVVKTAMQDFALNQGNNIYCNQNPLKRVALPVEIAELVSFMVSGACNFMVGQTIVVDGGFSLRG